MGVTMAKRASTAIGEKSEDNFTAILPKKRQGMREDAQRTI